MTAPTNHTGRPALGCAQLVDAGADPAVLQQAENLVNRALDRRIAASEARVLPATRGLRWEDDVRPENAGGRWCVAWIEIDREEVIPDG